MAESGDIFQTLFGGPSKDAPLSLFVDNPYRRQPQSDAERDRKPSPGAVAGGSEVHAGRRERDKRRGSDEEGQSSRKRMKESRGGEKAGENGGADETKRSKKRKRMEIEEEYEAMRYGSPVVGKIEPLGSSGVGTKRKTLDDAAETMVVSEEAYDDESKLQRTVFVGNLPVKVKKKALLKEFRVYGEIESVRIRSVPIIDTKIPRKGAIMKGKINEAIDSVHAYIVFKDDKHAEAALTHNMVEVGGNHIRVDRACPPRKKLKGDNAPLYDNKRTVFIGNLPFDVKDEELHQLFSGINQLSTSVEGVRVIRDPNSSLGKGIAYVLFYTREAANLAVRKKNLKLRDRVLRLCHSKSDSTPTKRQRDGRSQEDTTPRKRSGSALRESEKPKNKVKLSTPSPSIRSGSALRESEKPKNKVKPSTPSYQGLRATKSGVTKKSKSTDSKKLPTKRGLEAMPMVVRKNKRPAVAARKANSLKGNVSVQKSDKKRKPESGTPGSVHRAKKVRRVE